MKALIFAGGHGIALQPLTFTRPKVLLPIVNRPILHYVLTMLQSLPLSKITIITDYLSDQIHKTVAANHWHIPTSCIQISSYQGDACHLKSLAAESDDETIVIWGDCLFDLSLFDWINRCRDHHAPMGMLVHRQSTAIELQVISVANGWVSQYHPTSNASQWADGWVYYFRNSALNAIPPGIHSITSELIPHFINTGIPILAEPIHGYRTMIGHIPLYLNANKWVLAIAAPDGYIDPSAKIAPNATLIPPYFIDQNVAVHAHATIGPNTVLQPNVIVDTHATVQSSIVFANSHIGPRTTITKSVVGADVLIDSDVDIQAIAVIGDGAIINTQCTLLAGTRIGPKITVPGRKIIHDIRFWQTDSPPHTEWIRRFGAELSVTEIEICMFLIENNRLSVNAIANYTELPIEKLRPILGDLERQTLIQSVPDDTDMYEFLKIKLNNDNSQ